MAFVKERQTVIISHVAWFWVKFGAQHITNWIVNHNWMYFNPLGLGQVEARCLPIQLIGTYEISVKA